MRVAALAAATLSRHISSVYDGSDCPECSFTSRESEERVKASYGDNDERLATIKSKDDPTNFFRVNQNIKPAQEGESSMAIFQKSGKNVSGGQRLSPVIGIALLLLAVLWLAHPAWLLSSIGV